MRRSEVRGSRIKIRCEVRGTRFEVKNRREVVVSGFEGRGKRSKIKDR